MEPTESHLRIFQKLKEEVGRAAEHAVASQPIPETIPEVIMSDETREQGGGPRKVNHLS